MRCLQILHRLLFGAAPSGVASASGSPPPTSCCMINTDADEKSEEASTSPIAPCSWHSLQSVNPAVSDDAAPLLRPTMNRSVVALISRTAATVSSPLLTTGSMYNTDSSPRRRWRNSSMRASSRRRSVASAGEGEVAVIAEPSGQE